MNEEQYQTITKALDDINEKLRSPMLLMDAGEAAKSLGLSEWYVRQMATAHELPHMHLGRRLLFPAEMLREWIRDNVEGGDITIRAVK